MNYQVTCLCGQQFAVAAEQLGQHVPCPQCQRALIPLAAQGASAPTPEGATEAKPTKECPFCGETILAVAKKCKHCNEFLDRSPPSSTSSTPSSTAPTPAATPAPVEAPVETPPVFTLSVSQWDNFIRYLICLAIVGVAGVVLFFVIPKFPQYISLDSQTRSLVFLAILVSMVLLSAFFYLTTRAARCFIRPQRIETEHGLLVKRIDTLEMYRVTDVNLRQNIIQRIVGIGTINVLSSDPTTPELELYQIPHARKVYQYLRDQMTRADKDRGTVYIER